MCIKGNYFDPRGFAVAFKARHIVILIIFPIIGTLTNFFSKQFHPLVDQLNHHLTSLVVGVQSTFALLHFCSLMK